ncbi:glycosyltransferase involved in cell wall biosynthesis [Arcticibacter pallidicorallinus]|uniref:Glycosyltransferase involved in cell wall biosynthesis n=1 Tax=Arcticibacter pallidicorallinus TaxID=1259464 RepID=A0A2T0UB70_9SPHI|nr:glycosyltransferase [Arcticibacter pallidicorallinus]PRY55169.1 glycosyltransferase involved in cell wall biosynthesis [Arcticibacter pallidicorallinus]
MKIVFFTHPHFLGHQSMPRYANWLARGMEERGHQIDLWSPEGVLSALPLSKGPLKKWLGYVDQYLIFPLQVKKKLKVLPPDTLFVFTDHALGPWVPLVKNRPHIVHCHDFLAQRSALGEIPENVTGRTGKIYQSYIRKGYTAARNFISISQKTQADLHRMLSRPPHISEVVYNGLTRKFAPADDVFLLRKELSGETGINLQAGFILHVGGNLWYKNKSGVISAYEKWRSKSTQQLPLLLVGENPDDILKAQIDSSPFKADIHALVGMPDDFANKAYSAASLFLFPSLAEGFGWPILEAMASGCPVITTGEAPMSEVGGKAAFYVSKLQVDSEQEWREECAALIDRVLGLSVDERLALAAHGADNVRRFHSNSALDSVEEIYIRVADEVLLRRKSELHEQHSNRHQR